MGSGNQRFTVWHGLLITEGVALLIALVMPITPPKIGSGRGLAHLVIPDPTHLEEVLV